MVRGHFCFGRNGDNLNYTIAAQTFFKWTTSKSIFGRIRLVKIDDMGKPLAGAIIELECSDGSTRTGTSDSNGVVLWEDVSPEFQYVVREKQAPPGFQLADPINVSVIANETANITMKDTTST